MTNSQSDDPPARELGQIDADRFEALLAQHLPGLQGFLGRRASAWLLARESAEDLAQSACREAIEHLQDGRLELRTEAEFKQWLFQAGLLKLQARARFHTADRRDTRRDVHAIDPTGSAELGVDQATSATPSRFAATNEARARVRMAIAALGGRDQQILTLAILDERPHSEIAQTLGLELANSRMVLSRAMAKLAKRLLGQEL